MKRWNAEKANAWYGQQPWLVGCNFVPSTAANQLEMWQKETFDLETIARELAWAAGLGMNALRVYLHDLAWQADPDEFKERLALFLKTAADFGLRTMLVVFDDCWNDDPKPGPQPPPIPGRHNSRWVRSPGSRTAFDPSCWGRLETYLRDLLDAFRHDERVLLWDLYNEPGNGGQGVRSLPLLCKVFEWARDAAPSQPLTAGLWFDDPALNAFQAAASDVITFHNYAGPANLARQIADLRRHERPVLCTEWLRRAQDGGGVAECLPIFAAERVGCFNWGLVAGKTQTIFAWDAPADDAEPEVWFHDLLRRDGTPFDEGEARLFREATRRR